MSCWPVDQEKKKRKKKNQTKTCLTKQIRKSKSCSKRNASVTIICLKILMIKLPRLHRRLPVVLKAKLRTKQNDWWTGLAERTQRYAHMGDMCAFYEALKAVCGPSHQIQAPLRSSDGSTRLTDKEAILQCWSEHFEGLFSDQCTVQVSSLAKIPQVDVKLELDDPPTHDR